MCFWNGRYMAHLGKCALKFMESKLKKIHILLLNISCVQNLTKGQLHVTDVSNASRTMLMNIDTLRWDPVLCRFFSIPQHILPEIRSSAEIYGCISNPEIFTGIPIAGVSMHLKYTCVLFINYYYILECL